MTAARRKDPSVEQKASSPGFLATALIDDVIKKVGEKNCHTTNEMIENLQGIPIRPLMMQYIVGLDIIPHGRFLSLSGPPASYKSTTGYFFANENVLMGGVSFIINTEQKPNMLMPYLLAGPNKDTIAERLRWLDATSLEEVRDTINGIVDLVENLLKTAEKAKSPCPPILILVDSLSSALSKASQDASRSGKLQGYDDAQAANQLKKAFLSINARIQGLPITLMFVNHQHFKTASKPGLPPEEYDAGGITKDFVYSFRLTTRRPKSTLNVKANGEKTRTIYMKVRKNTMAITPNGESVIKFVSTKTGEKETERFVWFDFYTALVELLTPGEKDDDQKKLMLQWAEPMLKIKKLTGGKYSCPRYSNNEPMSAVELGLLIENDAEARVFLQDHVLGINRFKHYTEIANGHLVPAALNGDEDPGIELEEGEDG